MMGFALLQNVWLKSKAVGDVSPTENPVHQTSSESDASRNVLAHNSFWRFQNLFILVQFCAVVEQENNGS